MKMMAIAWWTRCAACSALPSGIRDASGCSSGATGSASSPLYYWERPDGVAFASELRSFLADPAFRPQLSEEAIALYLSFGYVPDPHCIFTGVRKLPPGHVLSWHREDGISLRRYWSPLRPGDQHRRHRGHPGVAPPPRGRGPVSPESEVPLGAFLSGGIDSSTVVALMARAMDRKVQTFSIGFEEPEYNEAPHAARVAAALGTDHTELIVRPDADTLVEDVIRGFDEPFADSSALPMLLVSHLARERVTVALSGDGGDELFGGIRVMRTWRTWNRQRRRPCERSCADWPCFAHRRDRSRLDAESRAGWRGRYASTVAAPLSSSEGGLATSRAAAFAPHLERVLDPWFERFGSRDLVTQMMLVDLETYLPGDILTKVDRMSMAVSLEARVPMLDHLVVEFAMGLPSRLKLQRGTGKLVLREAIAGLVPAPVLSRPKQGFAVPLDRWFRGPLRYRVDALTRKDARISEWVDSQAVQRITTEHLSGRRNHQDGIWRLVVLDGWLAALERGHMVGDERIHNLLGASRALIQ
jgi:asparagine synthase (glutamine-hydrolysing)